MDSRGSWPDSFDFTAIGVYLGLTIGAIVIGYALMVIDIRAYLRALRGALVKVAYHFQNVPTWARYETPHCLRALGLMLPCTEQEVREAYRSFAEKLHPDRGGDRKQFMQLQRDFEASMRFLRDHEPEFRSESTTK